MARFLVTGGNRGIGLEFVRQLRARGEEVIATARAGADTTELKKTGATILPLDVSDPASLGQFAEAAKGLAVDVLINNAGVSSTTSTLAACTMEELQRVFAVNSSAPVLVAQAMMPALRAGTGRTIVNITSVLGSITQNSGGSSYGYRASKAALNMFTVSMANELRPEGFTCIVMHPGWVKTDMGGAKAPLTPTQAVASMLRVIAELKPSDSGKYFNYDGAPIHW